MAGMMTKHALQEALHMHISLCFSKSCVAHRVTCLCSVGMLFLPDDDKLDAEARRIIEDVVAAEGRCRIVGWREVPVVKDCVGPLARENEPRIVQVRVHVLRSHQSILSLVMGRWILSQLLWAVKAKMRSSNAPER